MSQLAKANFPNEKELNTNVPAFSAGWRIGGRCGQERIRTSEVERQRIYSPPHLAALEPAHILLLITELVS